MDKVNQKDGDDFNKLARQKPTFLFYFLVFVATVGGPLLYGWHLGLLNNSDKAVRTLINSSINQHYGYHPSSDIISTWLTLSSTFYVLGGILGSLLIGWIAKLLGRRNAMIPLSVYGIISTILMSIAEPLNSFELMVAGRFLMGIHAGLYMGLSPLYISECSPTYFRGTSTVIVSVGITGGVLLSSVFALNTVFGKVGYLVILFALPLIPIVIHLAGLMICPESPRLLIERDRLEEATKALSKLRDVSIDELSAELNDIEEEFRVALDQSASNQSNSIFNLLRMKRWRLMIFAAVVIMCGQQLCGINGIVFYSKQTFENSGMNDTEATYGTLGTSVALFLGSIVAAIFVDKSGRKPLLSFGFLVMFINCVLLVPFLKFSSMNRICAIMSIICNIVFNIAFSIGPGGIGWMITPEMFPFEIRGTVCSFASGLNWICNVLVVTLFPILTNSLSSYTFLIFAVMNALCLAFTVIKVQETKGRTPAQVEQLYRNRMSPDAPSDMQLKGMTA